MTYMCTYVGRPGTRTQARAYVRREAWQDAQAQPFHTHERARVRTSSTLARTSVNPPTHNHAPYYHSPDGHMYARAQGGLARRTSSTLARTSVNPSTHTNAHACARAQPWHAQASTLPHTTTPPTITLLTDTCTHVRREAWQDARAQPWHAQASTLPHTTTPPTITLLPSPRHPGICSYVASYRSGSNGPYTCDGGKPPLAAALLAAALLATPPLTPPAWGKPPVDELLGVEAITASTAAVNSCTTLASFCLMRAASRRELRHFTTFLSSYCGSKPACDAPSSSHGIFNVISTKF